MNAKFYEEVEEHFHALNKEIETLIVRNESMMMQCQNFDYSLPYLRQYYDLASMKALNCGYLQDMNFPIASVDVSEAPAKKLNLEHI